MDVVGRAHLCGTVVTRNQFTPFPPPSLATPVVTRNPNDVARIAQLEAEVASLQAQLASHERPSPKRDRAEYMRKRRATRKEGV